MGEEGALAPIQLRFYSSTNLRFCKVVADAKRGGLVQN